MSKYYFDPINLFLLDAGIHVIPEAATEITKEKFKEIVLGRANGLELFNKNGLPELKKPEFNAIVELDFIKAAMRNQRASILDSINGIGWRASVNGNIDLAKESAAVAQQLLDITDDSALNAAQTYEDMRAAAMAAYRRIADSVSPGLRSAFKELEK